MHIFFSRPDCIFEIQQLWQSGFSRVYSNCCCSCSFEAEIIEIGQSSHNMYSNKIVNFRESMTILNAHMKKVWKLIVCLLYIYLWPMTMQQNTVPFLIKSFKMHEICHSALTALYFISQILWNRFCIGEFTLFLFYFISFSIFQFIIKKFYYLGHMPFHIPFCWVGDDFQKSFSPVLFPLGNKPGNASMKW